MFFLFSGEGPTDLGVCAGGAMTCEGADYKHGPMTVIASHIVEHKHRYSIIEAGCMGFVKKTVLTERASELKAAKKSLGLPGPKREKETRYFFNNARVFARVAKEKEQAKDDTVVAVLFRDADCEASGGRGDAAAKRQAIADGFVQEAFAKGVPMVPEPTSEAWLIEAFRKSPKANAVEDTFAGLKKADKLKKELEAMLGEPSTGERLRQLVEDGDVNINEISSESFTEFKARLEEVI